MTRPPPQIVNAHLWHPIEGQNAPQIYAVVDAARDPCIYPGLVSGHAEYLCLYRGTLADELADVAPYLVVLQAGAPLTHWLLDLGWGNSWGIFLASTAPRRELHRHVRRFLMVYDPDGTPLYFRYFDPRVFRVYLPTCAPDELRLWFASVNHYYVEDGHHTLLAYSFAEEALIQRRSRLTTSPLWAPHEKGGSNATPY